MVRQLHARIVVLLTDDDGCQIGKQISTDLSSCFYNQAARCSVLNACKAIDNRWREEWFQGLRFRGFCFITCACASSCGRQVLREVLSLVYAAVAAVLVREDNLALCVPLLQRKQGEGGGGGGGQQTRTSEGAAAHSSRTYAQHDGLFVGMASRPQTWSVRVSFMPPSMFFMRS